MKSAFTKLFTLVLVMIVLLPTMVSAHMSTGKGAAEDLRSALGQLLGEHALLAVTAMQKGYDGKADFSAAAQALNENTDDLTKAIASVYGEEAGKAFNPIWSSHILYFVDYVKATASKDEAAKQKALDNLEKYRLEQAEFFAGANPHLNEKEVAEGLKMHIGHLLAAFDSYVAKDYSKAYAQEREAYLHMFMTGDAIAGAIVEQFPGKFMTGFNNNPASDLRSALGQILGEHATAAVIAMQKGIDGAPDFESAAAWLNSNTDDLTKAIASVYGEEAGMAFKPIWSSHIGYFVDYVKATASKDPAAKQIALDNLEKYRMEQATFFAGANPNLNEKEVAEGLKMHIDHLLAAFDSYAAKDYNKAYEQEREAYMHMFMTGDFIAEAIVKQFPDQFHSPAGGGPAPSLPTVSTIKLSIGSKHLTVDGNMTMMDVAPLIKNGITFIPVRYLAESLGAEVKYDNRTKTTWIMAGEDKLAFWVMKDTMQLNGATKNVGAPVFIHHGRTEVPLRFIAELLGWKVNISGETITLTKSMM